MKSKTLTFVLSLCFIMIMGLGAFQKANAATNTTFTMHDLTDLGNPRSSEHLFVYTQSTSSPEAFSVSMIEGHMLGYNYDEFDISYQTSTATGEWTEETVYIWVDTNADGYRDSLQATLTGCLATYKVYVYARDIYGE